MYTLLDVTNYLDRSGLSQHYDAIEVWQHMDAFVKKAGIKNGGGKCGRGWVGIKGSCDRMKRGGDRAALQKQSLNRFAAKQRSGKNLDEKNFVALRRSIAGKGGHPAGSPADQKEKSRAKFGGYGDVANRTERLQRKEEQRSIVSQGGLKQRKANAAIGPQEFDYVNPSKKVASGGDIDTKSFKSLKDGIDAIDISDHVSTGPIVDPATHRSMMRGQGRRGGGLQRGAMGGAMGLAGDRTSVKIPDKYLKDLDAGSKAELGEMFFGEKSDYLKSRTAGLNHDAAMVMNEARRDPKNEELAVSFARQSLSQKKAPTPIEQGKSLKQLFGEADAIGPKSEPMSMAERRSAKQGADKILGETGYTEAVARASGKVRSIVGSSSSGTRKETSTSKQGDRVRGIADRLATESKVQKKAAGGLLTAAAKLSQNHENTIAELGEAMDRAPTPRRTRGATRQLASGTKPNTPTSSAIELSRSEPKSEPKGAGARIRDIADRLGMNNAVSTIATARIARAASTIANNQDRVIDEGAATLNAQLDREASTRSKAPTFSPTADRRRALADRVNQGPADKDLQKAIDNAPVSIPNSRKSSEPRRRGRSVD